jgi:hypothetical protein
MVIVGLDYGHAGQLTLDGVTGGSPYGATTIAGGDGSRKPTANELQGARYQGRKIGVARDNNCCLRWLLVADDNTRAWPGYTQISEPDAGDGIRRQGRSLSRIGRS